MRHILYSNHKAGLPNYTREFRSDRNVVINCDHGFRGKTDIRTDEMKYAPDKYWKNVMYFDFISIKFKMGKCRLGASVTDTENGVHRLSKLMLDTHPPATQSQAGSLLPEGEASAQQLAVWSQGPCLVCVCVHLIRKVDFSAYPWQWGREHSAPWEGSSSTAVCPGCRASEWGVLLVFLSLVSSSLPSFILLETNKSRLQNLSFLTVFPDFQCSHE